MTVVGVKDGEVTTQDSVAIVRAPTGRELRDGYLHDIQDLTLGLVRGHSNALYFGPLELLRFGTATVTDSAVEWPIEGGITALAAGGTFRIEASGGRLVASVDGFRPRLPMPLYAVSQLPVHHLLTRLYLLRVRGREPAPGAAAAPQDRIRAGAIDVAFCLTLAGLAGKRRRLPVLLGIAAAYHVACWSTSGRTLGGLVVRQRVVAVDGSRPTVMQSMVRFLALPLAWVARRPIHDELAGTDVIVS
jgi:RDD family